MRGKDKRKIEGKNLEKIKVRGGQGDHDWSTVFEGKNKRRTSSITIIFCIYLTSNSLILLGVKKQFVHRQVSPARESRPRPHRSALQSCHKRGKGDDLA